MKENNSHDNQRPAATAGGGGLKALEGRKNFTAMGGMRKIFFLSQNVWISNGFSKNQTSICARVGGCQ
jgi:hypothetical protein